MTTQPTPDFPADPCERAPRYVRHLAPYQPGKPISELAGVELTRLAELQVQAAGDPNTTLDDRGELAPL